MSEPTTEPEYAVASKPFIAVDRITQGLIVEQLQAALGQLDVITRAIQEDPGAVNLDVVYVNAVSARTYVNEALKHLPWAPIPLADGRRAGQPNG